MADNDWDSVTRIGSKARTAGGGGSDRERVVKGKSAINAAFRSGAITGTEKKYGSANSKANPEGQRLAKIDQNDAPIPLKQGNKEIGLLISQTRAKLNWTQVQLATKINITSADLQKYENGTQVISQDAFNKLENALNIKLRGKDVGQPKYGKRDEAGKSK